MNGLPYRKPPKSTAKLIKNPSSPKVCGFAILSQTIWKLLYVPTCVNSEKIMYFCTLNIGNTTHTRLIL